jgi:hypothetical protein
MIAVRVNLKNGSPYSLVLKTLFFQLSMSLYDVEFAINAKRSLIVAAMSSAAVEIDAALTPLFELASAT